MIPRIYRAEEIYHGEHLSAAPDLILVWWEDPNFTTRKSHPKFAGQPAVFYPTGPAVAGRDLTGIHRRDGILVACGPQLASLGEGKLPGADLVDIAPTALALTGLSVPSDMDGVVLEDIVAGQIHMNRPDGAQAPGNAGDDERHVGGYSEHEEGLIEKRLSDLGYVE